MSQCHGALAGQSLLRFLRALDVGSKARGVGLVIWSSSRNGECGPISRWYRFVELHGKGKWDFWVVPFQTFYLIKKCHPLENLRTNYLNKKFCVTSFTFSAKKNALEVSPRPEVNAHIYLVVTTVTWFLDFRASDRPHFVIKHVWFRYDQFRPGLVKSLHSLISAEWWSAMCFLKEFQNPSKCVFKQTLSSFEYSPLGPLPLPALNVCGATTALLCTPCWEASFLAASIWQQSYKDRCTQNSPGASHESYWASKIWTYLLRTKFIPSEKPSVELSASWTLLPRLRFAFPFLLW